MRTARMLARPGNGVLTEEEQAAFDLALQEVMQRPTDRLGRSVQKTRRVGPPELDPELRRSYLRTQHRLDAQAARARQAFPQLTKGWNLDQGSSSERAGATDEVEAPSDAAEDVSVGVFETEIEQTSDTLVILEKIAAIQQQQLEHQRSQLLSETRGVFFALAVSVAVIVAGIAPLVEASTEKRRLILLWTAAVCAFAGLGYAAVRVVQSRSD